MFILYVMILKDPICVFWDLALDDWSMHGCTVEVESNYSVTCVCDHLTSFGVIMDINGIIGEVT